MSLKVWKGDLTCHVPDLWFLSWSQAQPEGLGVRAGPQWETPCLPHLADLLERQAPQRRPQLMPRPGSGQVPGDPSRTSPPAFASTSDSSGSVLDLAEPRPQSSKTHVYFTRNLIHLVRIYLHLTHQMQFCKSRWIAKRLFCLRLPSERGQGRAAYSALRDQQGAVRVGGQVWFL